MHPVIGAAVESERLYVAQSRLAARLVEPGAGSAGALRRRPGRRRQRAGRHPGRARRAAGRPRRSPWSASSGSWGRSTLAASPEGAARLGWSAEDAAAARALLRDGRHEEPGVRWWLRLGDALERLDAEPLRADLVFWDPFSPKVNGALWTAGAFARLAARCAPGATLFTYSTATATRAALLLAGFAVGHGDASGPKEETTAAALPPASPARPLDGRWLARLARSSAPFPADAPDDALALISRAAAVPAETGPRAPPVRPDTAPARSRPSRSALVVRKPCAPLALRLLPLLGPRPLRLRRPRQGGRPRRRGRRLEGRLRRVPQAVADEPNDPKLREKFAQARTQALATSTAAARGCFARRDWGCTVGEADFALSIDPGNVELSGLRRDAGRELALVEAEQARAQVAQGQLRAGRRHHPRRPGATPTIPRCSRPSPGWPASW